MASGLVVPVVVQKDPHRGVLVQLGSLTELSKWTQDRRPEGEGATQGDVRLLSRVAGLYGRGVLNLHHLRKRESVRCVFRVLKVLCPRAFQESIPEWVAASSPGDLPDAGIEAMSLVSPALQTFFTTAPPGKPGSPLPFSFAHAVHTPGET